MRKQNKIFLRKCFVSYFSGEKSKFFFQFLVDPSICYLHYVILKQILFLICIHILEFLINQLLINIPLNYGRFTKEESLSRKINEIFLFLMPGIPLCNYNDTTKMSFSRLKLQEKNIEELK